MTKEFIQVNDYGMVHDEELQKVLDKINRNETPTNEEARYLFKQAYQWDSQLINESPEIVKNRLEKRG